MSTESGRKPQSLDPRLVLGLKYGSFFLGILLVLLFVALVLAPREDLQREIYGTRTLERLAQGQIIGDFQPLEDPDYSGYYPLEDGGVLAVVTSIIHQSQGFLAVRFDRNRVPVSIVPMSVPWFGRLTKAFPKGTIYLEYKPEMGVRALHLYEVFSRGGILR